MTGEPFQLSVEETPHPADVEQVIAGLVAYNRTRAEKANQQPLGVFLRADDRIIGGAIGYTHWHWLFVSHLWVDDTIRGHGAGRQLMSAIEEAACARGCDAAWLDTYSFQAPGFYHHLGYRQFGQLDDYPPSHTRHFLWKSLVDS